MYTQCRASFFVALLSCWLLAACQPGTVSGNTLIPGSSVHNASTSVPGTAQGGSSAEASTAPADNGEDATSGLEPVQEQSAAETPTSQRSGPPAPEKREGLPDPGFVLTDELGREIYERWEIAMEQGMDAPGALGEFLTAHPDFLYNQAGRLNTEAEDDPSQAWLVLYQGVPPDEDMLNRERLARFAQNIRDGVPDCIVTILSAAPIDPIPLWLDVLTYDGRGNTFREDSYSLPGYFYRLHIKTLNETEIEWMFTDEDGFTRRVPKYGYEPIPFTEAAGECVTKEQVREALVKYCEHEGRRYLPEDVEIPPHEIQEREPSMSQFGVPPSERQEEYYVFDLNCYFQAGGRDYNCGGSYAVAKDFSRFYMIEEMGGNWLLLAQPKPVPSTGNK